MSCFADMEKHISVLACIMGLEEEVLMMRIA